MKVQVFYMDGSSPWKSECKELRIEFPRNCVPRTISLTLDSGQEKVFTGVVAVQIEESQEMASR